MEITLAELKTQPSDASVEGYLNQVEDEKKRQDGLKLLELMQSVTGEEPRMWGDSIVGFGSYHYRYDSGRQGDWFLTGFSPRKGNLTLYIMSGFDQYHPLMKKLGRYSIGKSCLYVKKLDDIDLDTLRELVRLSAEHIARTNSG
jgi:Domain of unknown function (DU1801)